MARLTRTQKYAELRERMAHDSESPFSTPDLKKYEEKLTELDDLFKKVNNMPIEKEEPSVDLNVLTSLGDIELKKEIIEEPVQEEKDPFEKVSEDKMNKILSIEQTVEDMVSEIEKEIRKIAPVEVVPTYAMPEKTLVQEISSAVEEKVEEIEKSIEDLFTEKVEEIAQAIEEVEEVIEVEEVQEEVVEEEPVQEEVIINVPSYANEYEGISSRVDTIISLMDDSMKPSLVQEEAVEAVEEPEVILEPEVVEEPLEILEVVEEVETSPEVEEVVEATPEIEEVIETEEVEEEAPTLEIASEDLKDIDELLTEEPVQIEDNLFEEEAQEEVKIDNSFIDEALEEVKEYNLDKGNQTVDSLSNDLIEQVRHNDIDIPEDEDEDGDVSNTISLELDKVLNSMNDVLVEEPEVVETKEAEIVEEEVEVDEPTKVVDIAELEEDEEEHKAIAQTLEEDVVEIKSLDETLKIQSSKVVTNVLDDTVPFDISGDEEYEDDVPSKTLNIILGVLIAVLVLVLCVIVYYILVARGILG